MGSGSGWIGAGAYDPGCVKTLRGITAPEILSPVVMRRAKKAKIGLPLGATSKSDFVFTRPRPGADIGWSEIPQRSTSRCDIVRSIA
jgi:hypothetical protein